MTLESLEDRTVPSLTWQVQSDFFGTRDGVSQARSLRGLALSSDDQHVYAGFIQGTTSSAIRMVSSGINAAMIGNEPTPYGTNPPYTTGLEARVTTFNQPKGVATDDRDFVYATLTSTINSGSQNWGIYSTNLGAQVAVRTSINSVASTLSGIATAKLGGEYYVYVGWRNGQIERWNVSDATNPVLDTAWGAPATPGKITLKSINVNAYLNGLEVDTDGTIFVAGGLLNTSSNGDALIKIPAAVAASGTVSAGTTSSVPVQGGADGLGGFAAMDVALYAGKAYVTQYLAGNSTIGVFYTLDLSTAGIITPPNLTGPSGQIATYNEGPDSGFSGIEISGDGTIYVVEQIYKFYASTTNPANAFTPPGGNPILSSRVYLDRIIVSSALDDGGPLTTSVDITPNPAPGGPLTSVTLTATVSDLTTGGSTIAGAEYSTDGGTTWHPMDAVDGIFDEVTEDVTVTFTLGSAGLGSPNSYTIFVRGTDTASQTGPAASTTLDVVGTAPTITNSDNATFTVGTFSSFTFTTTGNPAPSLSVVGALPSGVTFVDNGDGTATLSGTPDPGTDAVYVLDITASNGVSPDATQTFTLTVNAPAPVTVVPGPVSGYDLIVYGTGYNDKIAVHVTTAAANRYRVSIESRLGKTLVSKYVTKWLIAPGPITRTLVYGLDGNDNISANTVAATQVWMFGGNGNDTLAGSRGNDVLVGGDGNDRIQGGPGANLLIGGMGADTIKASGKLGDILISGWTIYDVPTLANLASLSQIMDEWTSGTPYATRVDNLLGPVGGLNGTNFLNSSTVFDDAEKDTLNGGSGRDWYFARTTGMGVLDVLKKKTSLETLTEI